MRCSLLSLRHTMTRMRTRRVRISQQLFPLEKKCHLSASGILHAKPYQDYRSMKSSRCSSLGAPYPRKSPPSSRARWCTRGRAGHTRDNEIRNTNRVREIEGRFGGEGGCRMALRHDSTMLLIPRPPLVYPRQKPDPDAPFLPIARFSISTGTMQSRRGPRHQCTD